MCLTPIWLRERRIYVPCGKCKACLMKTTYDWAHRIMIEAAHHNQNCVVTLTYNDEHYPIDGLLCYRDVQLFLKRLRKAVAPIMIRFFVSGEYGDLKGRPHYHMIIFGYFPTDTEYMFQRHGNRFYKSELMNTLWGNGFATVGTLTEKSAFYCAKYLQKLNFSHAPVKPFVHMSLKPGIGYQAYSKEMLNSKKLYLNGRACSLPRFYYKSLQRDFPEVFEDEDYKAEIRYRMSKGVDSVTALRRSQINESFKKKFTFKY